MTMDYEIRKRWLTNNLKASLKTKMESYAFGEEQVSYEPIQFTLCGYIDEDWRVTNEFINEIEIAYLRAIKTMDGFECHFIKKDDILPAIRKISQFADNLNVVSVNPAIYYINGYQKGDVVEGCKVVELANHYEKILPISLVFLQKNDLPYVSKMPDGSIKVEFTQSDDKPYITIGRNTNAKALQLIIDLNGKNETITVEDIKNIWI